MRCGIPVALSMFLTSGCILNDAYELRDTGGGARAGHATIIFSAKDAAFTVEDTGVGVQLDHFSLEDRKITGDCFRYTRLEAARNTAPHATAWFVFSAPPGYYVVSPFSGVRLDTAALTAFLAPPDVVTYFGDFNEAQDSADGGGMLVRTQNLSSAAVFAASRGLPEPIPATTVKLEHRGPIFVCTP